MSDGNGIWIKQYVLETIRTNTSCMYVYLYVFLAGNLVNKYSITQSAVLFLFNRLTVAFLSESVKSTKLETNSIRF